MITAALLPAGVHLNHPEGLFIDGHWAAPADGGNLEIVCPNSEEVVARVAEAGESDMDAAVQAARRAFDHGPWPHLPIAERVRCLRAMAARLQERQRGAPGGLHRADGRDNLRGSGACSVRDGDIRNLCRNRRAL